MSEHNEPEGRGPAPTQMNMEVYRRPGGFAGLGKNRVFCSVSHPANPPNPDEHPDVEYAFCRRLVGHDGDHAAFVFSISVPETWPNDDCNRRRDDV